MAATIASRSARGTSSRRHGREAKLAARDELRAPALAELARLDDAAFRALFAKSPVKRIGRDRFIRNVLIAIGNSGDSALAGEAERLLDDESPLVRGAAVWALSQLIGARGIRGTGVEAALSVEADDGVRAEWPMRDGIAPPTLDFTRAESVMVPRHDKSALLHHATATPSFPPPAASGPWDPKSLHGRVIIGLLAFVIEQRHGADDFVPARLTVDMFRLPTLAPIEVKIAHRSATACASRWSRPNSSAAASAWRGRPASCCARRENPEGKVWSPPNWDVPAPADIPAPTDPRLGMNGKWTTRPIVGAMGTVGPRRLWMSEVRDLVEGTPLTPFVRVAVAADFASPFANAGDQGLGYINSDVTLYLHRLPVTQWIGFEVVNHHATDGIAIGECCLYDEQGPIGTSTVAALAQRKPMAKPPP